MSVGNVVLMLAFLTQHIIGFTNATCVPSMQPNTQEILTIKNILKLKK